MQRAMFIAATGMQAQQFNVDTIAHNLANVNTTGFRKGRAEFQDLLYQQLASPGAASSVTTDLPAGVQLGHGVKLTAVRRQFTQGTPRITGNDTDMSILGDGFFSVLNPDGTFAYTRDGSFTRNANGDLVTTSQGYPLASLIRVPENVTEINISTTGRVSALVDGVTQELGDIALSRFPNAAGLEALGGNLFAATEASGIAIDGSPGDDGFGEILQRSLEGSNVAVVEELVDLITAQRAYELNSRSVTTADQMLSTLTNLVR